MTRTAPPAAPHGSSPDRREATSIRRRSLPRGSRDLLPQAARRRGALTQSLLGCFADWGYAQVHTPAIEYYDVLAAGLSDAERKRCVRFIAADTQDVVALRSDLTPQIARMLAEHRGSVWPSGACIRVCYAGDVVRLPAPETAGSEHTEMHQVGVELVGDGDAAADAELVALGIAALRSVGLEEFCIDVSHHSLVAGTLAWLGLDAARTQRLRHAIERKDLARALAVYASQGQQGRGQQARAAISALCTSFGPNVDLEGATSVLRAPEAQAGLVHLQQLASHLRVLDPTAAAHIVWDLGETRGFDYYTGFRIRVWVPGVARPVLRGGRYDDLLGRYGEADFATGFALDLEALEQALPPAAQVSGPSGHMVAVDPALALRGRQAGAKIALAARAQGMRAWTQSLGDRGAAIAVADKLGANVLSLVTADGAELKVCRLSKDAAQSQWVEG